MLVSAAPETVGEVGVHLFGPVLIRMAAPAAPKGFSGQSLTFAPYAGVGGIQPVAVAVGAGGKVLNKPPVVETSLPVNAQVIFFDHPLVGKIQIGRRLLDVAAGGAIDSRHLLMGNFVQVHMAAFAPQLAVDRIGEELIIDIVDMFVSVFIIAPEGRIPMAYQAVFFIGGSLGLCETGQGEGKQEDDHCDRRDRGSLGPLWRMSV